MNFFAFNQTQGGKNSCHYWDSIDVIPQDMLKKCNTRNFRWQKCGKQPMGESPLKFLGKLQPFGRNPVITLAMNE